MARGWELASGLSVAREEKRLHAVSLQESSSGDLQIVWLGHACFLLRWRGVSLLIDPVFRKWIGVFPRLLPLPRIEEIGFLDAVLVSHGHMDHLDEGSIRSVDPRRIVIPRKTAGFLGRDLRDRCEGVALDQGIELGPLRITVVRAAHGGWRYPWQRGYFACGFVISDGERTVYAAGDTAFGEHFGEIGCRWEVDTALLPIGAYSPQWFLQKRHLNPEEACRAAKDLRAREVMPFHFGTYRLSLEPQDEPLRRFAVAAREANLDWRVPLGLVERG